MKYATFKDFVRDAYYHAADLGTLEIDVKGVAEVEQVNKWRVELRQMISQKRFVDAETELAAECNWVRIPGVVTYLPTEEAVKRAYQEDKNAKDL